MKKRSLLVGLASAIVSGIIATALSGWFEWEYDRNLSMQGHNPSGAWVIPAYAVTWWEWPVKVIEPFSPAPPHRNNTDWEHEHLFRDLSIILLITLTGWTVLVGGAHYAWTVWRSRDTAAHATGTRSLRH